MKKRIALLSALLAVSILVSACGNTVKHSINSESHEVQNKAQRRPASVVDVMNALKSLGYTELDELNTKYPSIEAAASDGIAGGYSLLRESRNSYFRFAYSDDGSGIEQSAAFQVYALNDMEDFSADSNVCGQIIFGIFYNEIYTSSFVDAIFDEYSGYSSEDGFTLEVIEEFKEPATNYQKMTFSVEGMGQKVIFYTVQLDKTALCVALLEDSPIIGIFDILGY